jgi:hypothetical protein
MNTDQNPYPLLPPPVPLLLTDDQVVAGPAGVQPHSLLVPSADSKYWQDVMRRREILTDIASLTPWQHVSWGAYELLGLKLVNCFAHLSWAVQRALSVGDYSRKGYFYQQGVEWEGKTSSTPSPFH